MELRDFIKNNSEYNPALQNEINKIDNKIESTFHSRYDNCAKNDNEIINRIKLCYYNNELESEDDKKQKQINKILSVFGKNYKQRIKSQFKPLSKPKKISLEGKVFINNSNISSNNNIINSDENKVNKSIFITNY